MIQRIDRKNIDKIPKANIVDGVALCPKCWKPLAEPVRGEGDVAVWCRQCKEHRVIRFRQ